jgi:hypothetical protein
MESVRSCLFSCDFPNATVKSSKFITSEDAMTANGFRKMALSLPETAESVHMNHPDFRVGGKVFATLGYPDKSWGMVKLSPKQQAAFVKGDPKGFVPVKGAWGRQGATNVHLPVVNASMVRKALEAAWYNTAPKRLSATIQGQVL